MPITIEGEFVKCDDKNYFIIKKIDSEIEVSHIESDIDNGFWSKIWTIPINMMMNRNWTKFKSGLEYDKEKYNAIIKDIFTPILKNVTAQDIYQN